MADRSARRRPGDRITALLAGLLYAASWIYGALFFRVAFTGGDVTAGVPLFLFALAVILFVHRRRRWPPFAPRR